MTKIIIGLISLFIMSALSAATFKPGTRYQLCFTPYENCADLIVKQIEQAKKSILVQAYSFTNRKIARALVAAHERGVDVKIIFDKSQFHSKHYSSSGYLREHGIPVWNDDGLNIAHNKVMVFDGSTVETGSFNYTYSAQHYNAENVLIIHSKALAKQYIYNWHRRQEVAKLMKKVA